MLSAAAAASSASFSTANRATRSESGLRNGGLGVESLGDDVELGFQQALCQAVRIVHALEMDSGGRFVPGPDFGRVGGTHCERAKAI